MALGWHYENMRNDKEKQSPGLMIKLNVLQIDAVGRFSVRRKFLQVLCPCTVFFCYNPGGQMSLKRPRKELWLIIKLLSCFNISVMPTSTLIVSNYHDNTWKRPNMIRTANPRYFVGGEWEEVELCKFWNYKKETKQRHLWFPMLVPSSYALGVFSTFSLP